MRLAACIALAALLAGCGPNTAAPSGDLVKAPTPKEAPPPTPTPEEWRLAMLGTHTLRDSNETSDGVTEAVACFKEHETQKTKAGEPACEHFAFSKRDAFRKIRHFTPGVYSRINAFTYLRTYISLPDNKAPLLFLAPHYAERGSWIFLSKVAVMADGEVLLEEDFTGRDVSRDQNYPLVVEQFDFVASEAQIAALRTIATAQKISVRFTGSKGYFSMPKDFAKSLQSDIKTTLYLYDRLGAAIQDKIPPGG